MSQHRTRSIKYVEAQAAGMQTYDAIYLRVSTDHQTIEQQEQQLNMMCRMYDVDPESSTTLRFEDHAKSANKPKFHSMRSRPEGEKLWKLIELGCIKRLIVLKLDRLYRNGVSGVVEVTDMIQKHGVQVIAVMGGGVVDVSTADGFFSFWSTMGKAQAECMATSERVKNKQTYQLSVGRAIGGKAFGWTHEKVMDGGDGIVHPVYEQQAVIAWAIARNEGRFQESWNGLAKVLNRKGVVGAEGRPGTWRSQSLMKSCTSVRQQHFGPDLRPRNVKHPILGTVRIGGSSSVTADCWEMREEVQV